MKVTIGRGAGVCAVQKRATRAMIGARKARVAQFAARKSCFRQRDWISQRTANAESVASWRNWRRSTRTPTIHLETFRTLIRE